MEDDRVLGGVVVGLRLAGDRLDAHLDGGVLPEREVREVREGDGLRLAGVDHVDRAGLHDRRRLTRDRQRHLDADLLVLAGVLDADLEREVGRGRDLRLRRGRELNPLREHLRVRERASVQAAGRAAGRGTVDALPDRAHRAGRVELDVLDEHRRRCGEALDALRRHRRLRGSLEEVLPDDVARLEAAPPRGELLAGGRLVVGVLRRLERVEQALQPVDAQLRAPRRRARSRASAVPAGRGRARARRRAAAAGRSRRASSRAPSASSPGVVRSVARSAPILAESLPTSPTLAR